jgi:hypothetical protein
MSPHRLGEIEAQCLLLSRLPRAEVERQGYSLPGDPDLASGAKDG